jgi:hypothetical protein
MAPFELIISSTDSVGESMAVFKCRDSLAVRGMSSLLNLPCEECKFRCPRHVRALARTDALCCSVRGRASIQNRNKSSKASVENPCRPRGVLLARRSRRSWCLCLIQVLTLDANAPVREPKMAANAEICGNSCPLRAKIRQSTSFWTLIEMRVISSRTTRRPGILRVRHIKRRR